MKISAVQSSIISFLLTLGVLFSVSDSIGALEVPPLTGRITDHAHLLSSSTVNELESYLAAVENSSGAQIALLTIPSLEGDSLESYSIQVVQQWALGQSGQDNGVLLLVALAEKKIRIEVGYGLEGILTDAMSGYIIRSIIVPGFKSGNFETGIVNGLQAIAGITTGDAPISQQQIEKSASRSSGNMPVPLFLIIFILIFILTRMGGYRRYRRRGISPGAALFMGMMLGSGSRHRGGSFGSSSGGFGGGFSGGGGGFGGGGASGGW